MSSPRGEGPGGSESISAGTEVRVQLEPVACVGVSGERFAGASQDGLREPSLPLSHGLPAPDRGRIVLRPEAAQALCSVENNSWAWLTIEVSINIWSG